MAQSPCYLSHREPVEDYLAERLRRRAEVRREVEARSDPISIRSKLLASLGSLG